MLTEFKIKHAKPGYWLDSNGLYLQVTVTGARSWIYRYQMKGKRREMGLGSLTNVSAKEARRRAAAARALALDKIDPLERRRQEREEAAAMAAKVAAGAVTFKAAALDLIETKRPGWRSAKHADQWLNTLAKYVFPVFGDRPVADINRDLVLQVLTPIWLTKTETATRVRSRIEIVLDAAKAKDFREGENPARWRGYLDKHLPPPRKVTPVTHHPALAYAQMAKFFGELRQRSGVSALCLEFAILTACRSGEALNAVWSEIDEDAAEWVIPKRRMKTGKAHRVPLSPAALAVLKKAKKLQQGDYIFPGVRSGRPMSDMSLAMLLRELRPGVTVHGFRSSFRDWAAEATHYPSEMAEMALAHVVGNKVEAAYRRGDMLERRRQMMVDWAAWCARKETKNVVSIKTAA